VNQKALVNLTILAVSGKWLVERLPMPRKPYLEKQNGLTLTPSRHIAEKHVRQMGKSHITEAFGTLIGHSKEMGDKYADQITSEYELTEAIVDNWWE
jgi:hypothetical protein